MLRKKVSVGIPFCATVVVVMALQATAQNIIGISSYEDLIKIGAQPSHPMDGNYELTQNINASASRTNGFIPIGGYGSAPGGEIDTGAARCFTGTFDGKSRYIRELYINRPNADYVGLFGCVGTTTSEATTIIKNVHIIADTIKGKNYVGAFAGIINGYTTISDCSVEGTVEGSVRVGGLVGHGNRGGIIFSNFDGVVNGDTLVGGLAGYFHSNIENSIFDGAVNGKRDVGGIVGEGYCNFRKSRASGTVTGITNVGGLAGVYRSPTRNFMDSSYSTAVVNGHTAVGGLIGFNNGGYVSKSYATGSVSGIGNNSQNVGGLIGYSTGSVYYSYAIGTVSGLESLGGLIGSAHNISVSRSYAAGNVEGISRVGGLVGHVPENQENSAYVKIENCYSVSNLTVVRGGMNSAYVGGLIGESHGSNIQSCYFTGLIRSADSSALTVNTAGALIGSVDGDTLVACYWDTLATGISNAYGNVNSNIELSQIDVRGKSTSDMTSFLNYGNGFDFSSEYPIWNIEANEHYAYLREFPTQKLTYIADANGSISGSTKQTVNTGAAQAVVAVPNPGYHFVSWSDGVKTAERRDTYLTSNTLSVTAVFGVMYTLKYSAGENGSLRGDTLQSVVGSLGGTEVIAVADSGYHFVEWSDGVKTQARRDLNVSKDIEVTAIFHSGVSVKHQYLSRANRPLVTVRGKTLNINAEQGVAVRVRVVNLRGRTVASFKSTGSDGFSLQRIPAGAYIIEAKKADGYRMTKPVTLK